MENKVYYGEYSLKHWIDLILKGNILLPPYQRSFVWEKEKIERLIKTLDANEYVPPVIIGAVKENDDWNNYILDGQQRLTSILFAKCNKYINKKEYINKNPDAKLDLTADDMVNEDEEEDVEIKMIKWNFNQIIKCNKIDSNELKHSYYYTLFINEKESKYFEERFLGFAYIKPGNNINSEDQLKFYSNIFKNINTGGIQLTRSESRKAMYFLKENLNNFFSPGYLDSYKVLTSRKESGLIDFIKYLSILSQYKGINYLLKYGGRDWEKNEKYYNEYINSITENNCENNLKFDISYPGNPYNNERMDKFEIAINKLNVPKIFDSIIDMDMYFFGLVNEVIFNDNEIDATRKDELGDTLRIKIDILKNTDLHKHNPSALKYLKARIEASVNIYKGFIK